MPQERNPIRVLIVDDSATARLALAQLLEDDGMRVVGEAVDGRQAVAMAARLRPDIVTMDYRMPVMDGIEATRRIMSETPLPVVIVSEVLPPGEAARNFRALEAGALTVLRKPRVLGGERDKAQARELVRSIRALANIRVVRRRAAPAVFAGRQGLEPPPPPRVGHAAPRSTVRPQVVVIGASTGGPQALKTLLEHLPATFPLPLVVVQHISRGFLGGLISWLKSVTPLTVREATSGVPLAGGEVVFAPDGAHTVLARGAYGGLVLGSRPCGEGRTLCPAVAELFASAAEVVGPGAVGLLLTGMGRDGAAELKRMRETGAMTMAQDKDSSIIHGMPGAAISLGGAEKVLPPEEMAALLLRLTEAKDTAR